MSSVNSSTHDVLMKLLRGVAENERINNFQINSTGGGVKGDGYLGEISSAEIIGTDSEGKKKILSVVVKSAKRSDALRSKTPIKSVFDREIFVYETVLPLYRKLEIEKGLSPTRFAPKFYKSDITEKNEALVFENLRDMDYKLFERRRTMNAEHVSLVLSQYGRFHAVSYALRHHYPEKFKEITAPLDDVLLKMLKEGNLMMNFTYRYKKSLETLDPVKDKEALSKCQYFGEHLEEFVQATSIEIDQYSALLHGDCWTNNMMFKYDTDNPDKPIKVDFIDFQLMKLGSPALDLSYFFYVCSCKDVIDNYKYFLRLYYDSLATHLRQLKCDPDKLFPYTILEDHWKKYARFGLAMAGTVIHVMLTESDETIDLADIANAGGNIDNAFYYEIANKDEFNDRIKHLLFHFVQNGLLN